MTILENPKGKADSQIFNLGNPSADLSIETLAHTLIDAVATYPKFAAAAKKAAEEKAATEKKAAEEKAAKEKKAAEEKNAENLLIIRSKELAKPYLENWQRHREHSAA